MLICSYVQADLVRLTELTVDPARRNGAITILAVAAAHRRENLGTALCEHAFDAMRQEDAEVVEIGTGGDEFHAPARAL